MGAARSQAGTATIRRPAERSAPSRAPDTEGLLKLQQLAGNQAVASLVTGTTTQRKKRPPVAPSIGADADFVNGWADIVSNADQERLAALRAVRFGPDLDPDQRALLTRVRKAVLQAGGGSREKRLAQVAWPALASQLREGLGEVRKRRPRNRAVVANAINAIDVVTKLRIGAAGAAEEKAAGKALFDDAHGTVNGINDLLYVFLRVGEAGAGIQREQVEGREEVEVNSTMAALNAKQRQQLAAVRFGAGVSAEHKQLLGKLRTALVLARSDTPGSAYKALAIFRSIQRDLGDVLAVAPNFRMSKEFVSAVRAELQQTRSALDQHHQAVHTENIGVALTRKLSPEQVKTERKLRKMGGAVGVAVQEHRVVDDFKAALEVIQKHITPSPFGPGEFLLVSGTTQVRVREDQVAALRGTVSKQLKDYMAGLVDVIAQAWRTQDEINRGTAKWKQRVLGAIGGADDPGDQEGAKNAAIKLRDTLVYPSVDKGQYMEAFETILTAKVDIERRAKAVAEWEADLDKGYARLSAAASIVQAALVALVPVAGQAALAAGAGYAAVGAASVGAGFTGAFGAETGRQVAAGEDVDLGKSAKKGWQGAVIGAGALAPAAGKGLGNALAAGEQTGVTAVGANALAEGIVGGAQTALSGGDALAVGQSVGGGAIGSVLGAGVKAIGPAAQRPLPNAVLAAGTGATSNALTGQDIAAGAAGGAAGSLATSAFLPGGQPRGNKPVPDDSAAAGTATRADPVDPLAATVEVPDAPTAVDTRPAATVSGAPEAFAPTVTSTRGDVDPRAATVEVPDAPTASDPRPARHLAGGDPHATTAPGGAGATVDSVAPGSSGESGRPGGATAGTGGPSAGGSKSGTGGTVDTSGVDPRAAAPNPRRPEGPRPADRAEYEVLHPNEQLHETPHGTWDDVDLPSVPRGAEYQVVTGAVTEIGPPPGGLSAETGSLIVERNGQKYLFKPASGEVHVNRASARGIRSGEYGPRAKAAAELAGEQGLGVGTPDVELVVLKGKKGTLTKWVDGGRTLKDIYKSDPVEYQRIVDSPEYQKARAAIDAFDYLINNLDRNGGNLIVQLDAQGRVTRLVPIDHDLTFTATPERAVMKAYANDLPTEFSTETIQRLRHMSANRQQLTEALGPLIGWEAVPGTLQRLDKLLAAANAYAAKHQVPAGV